MNEERRGNPRYIAYGEVHAKAGTRNRVRIVDLSRNGVGVRSEIRFLPGQTIDLSIPLTRGDFAIRARVCRCRALTEATGPGPRPSLVYEAGMEFLDMDEETAERLELAILAICGLPFCAESEALPAPQTGWRQGSRRGADGTSVSASRPAA